jgi:hypothetical protein
MGLAGGAVYVWFLAPLLVDSWFLNGPQQVGGFINDAWVTAILLGLMMVPLGGAISLLTLQLSDEQRGIIALFVMVFAFIGIVVLATYLLEYLLPLWPFVIAGMIWIPLAWMGIKAFSSNAKKER